MMDAADGRIDGRIGGQPIVNAGGYGAVPMGYGAPVVTNNAMALDAADGVIDGRINGAPIVQGGMGGYPMGYGAPMGAPMYGGGMPYGNSYGMYGGKYKYKRNKMKMGKMGKMKFKY